MFTLELLSGFGFANGKWNSPNEREHIPDQKNNLTGLSNTLRLEVSVGFVFPRVKLDKVLTDVPSVESVESDKQEVAQDIIYRKRTFRGRNLRFALYANDSVATHVTNGFYYEYILPPGKVKFKARTETSYAVTVTLEKGKTYYLRCRVLPGMFLGQPYLEIVPTQIGRDESNAIKR